MASVIHLDTHVAAWLYAGRSDLLPAKVLRLLDREELEVSPMVPLELQYLYEAGKTSKPAGPVVEALQSTLNLRISALPFERVAAKALDLDFTRDPFDRLIAAQAMVAQVRLVTKDRSIRGSYRRAVWE